MILTDRLHRLAYATDASVYREVPYGVAYPANKDDIIALLHQAAELQTSIIPRAGGTSIAGQVVGSGIVADISRYMNHILEINPEKRFAIVEPGVVRDELNLACKPYGLFFSPETSTSNRCCIGGMVGNNSCGTHSLVYGSTRPHVLEADAVLADGTTEHFADYTIQELEARFGREFWTNTTRDQALIQQIYAQLICFAIDPKTQAVIETSYPDKELKRRSCGYAIDEVIADLTDPSKPFSERTINLCKLITGSEGTLAFLYRIKVSLDPLPKKEVMVLCAHCTDLDASFEANLIALKHQPTAIELMDGDILELSKHSAAVERFFVAGDPAALLISELRADTRAEIDHQADLLEQDLTGSGLVKLCTRVYGAEVAKVWNLRKAGLGILNGMPGEAKPTGVIEDTAVAPSRLPAYMKDFQAMLKRLGTSCVFYGHISTGELHLRPILNLKTQEGKELFRRIARETTLLVRKHRGTISGEHGDGRLRGEFIPLQYGEEAYRLMQQVKYCWDTHQVFNPHKIVDTPRMDESLRADRSMMGNDLLCRVEKCNGAGDCRKSELMGGTMCPAYKVSHNELHTTRARANILREYLTDKGEGMVTTDDVQEVLSSCLACKACRRECPSGVDLTRLRAEVLQHIYHKKGTPIRTWLVAHNNDIQRLGSRMPTVYNFFATNRLTSSILKKIVGFAPERAIPQIAKNREARKVIRDSSLVVRNARSEKRATRSLFLFQDEFTRYEEPELIATFIRLMKRLGYEVVIPQHVESGRAAISKGCLNAAKRYAEKNVRLLSGLVSAEMPLVGIEPSCILTFRDEYPELVRPEWREAAKELAKNTYLFDEFLMREVEAGHIKPEQFRDLHVDIWLHGHCHQKSLVGVEKSAALLSLPPNARVHVIPSGCCGMAGSFGYEKAHYQTSLAIGEMVLFPAVRKAMSHENREPRTERRQGNAVSTAVGARTDNREPMTLIAAPGISCRTQIKDGTGYSAHHPIEILFRLLK